MPATPGLPTNPTTPVFRSCATATAVVTALVVAGMLTPGCASRPAVSPTPDSKYVVIPETYESFRSPADNIDSLAVWAPGGWVLATAKSTDSVLVLRSADGSEVKRMAGSGTGGGQLRRPNGIAVVDDLLLVVERDNHRVQVIRLPGLEPLGLVGENVLRFPYGITAFASEPGRYELFVTDSYLQPDGSVPPDDQLGGRVKHFRVELTGDGLRASLVHTFGATTGPGILHIVESIAVDPSCNRLLIADEAAGHHDIKVYTMDGAFTGLLLGSGVFQAEPEGIALLARGTGGYWITTDQQKTRTVFHLLDRRTLAFVGAFTGRVVANTDGIVVASAAVEGFPEGALFAVHNDASVAAFSWPAIATALALPSGPSVSAEGRGDAPGNPNPTRRVRPASGQATATK